MRTILLVLTVLALAIMPFAASAQASTPIALGDTVQGELTASANANVYSLEVEAGTTVQITLVSDDFDPYLVLSDAEGNQLVTDDDSAGNLGSRISYTFADAATYQITATSFAAHNGSTGATGAYTLSVTVVEVETIEYGETVNGTLTPGALALEYSFTAAPGDSVIIRLESDDFDSYLRLRDPRSSEIATNDDGAGNLNSLIGPMLLTEGGVYTIVASSLGGSATGNFVLSLMAASLEPITAGEPVQGELTAANDIAYYVFEANAGDVIGVTVESDIDTNLAINDPYNYQVTSDEDGGKGNNPELSDVVLSSSGMYTIIVGSPFSETGSFTIEVTRATLPSLNDGPITLRFSSSVNSRVLNYTASAGDVLRLTVSSVSGSLISPNVDIQQNGSSVAYGSASSVTEFSYVFTASVSGDLILNVSEYSYADAQVEVR
ncbi:MAG TPA: hypothetical protein VER79_04455, partial [Candidatus Limnocylindrales bacterium]|nr:hypothetical protein [Candidatus Limnocylindrales bacterium]